MTINPLTSGASPLPFEPVEGGSRSQAPKAGPNGLSPSDIANLLADLDEAQMAGAKSAGSALAEPRGDAGDVSGTIQQMNSLPKTLNIDITAMLRVFQEVGQQMRTTARETRQQETQAMVSAQMQAAEKIREAAHERMIGGIVNGAMQIAGGAIQMGGAIKGARDLAGSQTQHTLTTVQNRNTITGGIAAGVGGVGQITQSAQDAKASGHDARKAELDAMARVHESGREESRELSNQMMEVIRDIQDKLGGIEQSRLETNRGIARNI